MAYTVVTLVVGALSILILYLLKVYTYWKRRGIPTAKGIIPLLGHVLPLLTARSNYLSMVSKMYEESKNHSMFGFYKFTEPVLVICEPKLVKTVLLTNWSSFRDNAGGPIPEVDPLLSTNPIFRNGDAWLLERKRLISAFSSMRLKMLFEGVSGVCTKFHDFVDRRLKSSGKYEVELKYLVSKFMHEVVANAGLGIEGHCFQDEPHPMAFDRFGDEIFKPSTINVVKQSIVIYLPKFNNILRVGIFPKYLVEFFSNLTNQCLEARKNDTTPRNDFLQVMADIEKTNQQKGRKDILAAHMSSLYTDAVEATSVTVAWIGYHLATHKDVQEKLRAEVQSTIAKHGGKLTYEALKEMKYMDQVMSESQRCIATVGVLRKECTEECQLQGSDGLSYRVKPGTRILIPIKLLHADPEYWPDPQVFDPDRFSEERKNEIKKMTFLPFGEGPRMCVGMRMALLQIKSCLASLLNNYKLELSAKTQLPLQMFPSISLTVPVGGIWVNISKL
ncbi:putative cytochrome P450 28d1 [Andrena cerasifolii]|uniref:putative cytochrome P450 28d1 n=1 Tax=Andrena cerasifolii TaxID=2819439 RepID=UPI004038401F